MMRKASCLRESEKHCARRRREPTTGVLATIWTPDQ